MMRLIRWTYSYEAAQQMQAALQARFISQRIEILPGIDGIGRPGFLLRSNVRLKQAVSMYDWIDGWWTAFSAAKGLATILNDATKPDLQLAKS